MMRKLVKWNISGSSLDKVIYRNGAWQVFTLILKLNIQWFINMHIYGVNNSTSSCLSTLETVTPHGQEIRATVSLPVHRCCLFTLGKDDSTRFWTLKLVKNRIFCYPAQCGRGPTPLWRAVPKRCIFGQRIHWFYSGGRSISVRTICGFSYIIVIRGDWL